MTGISNAPADSTPAEVPGVAPISASGDSFLETRDLNLGELIARLGNAPRLVTVIMPIYNAAAAVAASLEALFANTARDVPVILVNDASTQPEIALLLKRASTRENVRVVTNDENLGFTRTVNCALSLLDAGDAVILNSDAEVGPMWLQRLRWVAYSADDVGTVSAVSNHAGTMSIPLPHQNNVWHPRLSRHEVSRIVARGMWIWRQEVPAGHGFCLYITETAREQVGGLDELSFPLGYGEEVDFSQRVIRHGMRNFVAPHVMVAHRRAQSFGHEMRTALIARSREVLRRLHPTLQSQVKIWETSVGDKLIRLVANQLAHRPAGCTAKRVVVLAPVDEPTDPAHSKDEHLMMLHLDGDGIRVVDACPTDLRPTATIYSYSANTTGAEAALEETFARIILFEAVEAVRPAPKWSRDSARMLALASLMGLAICSSP